MSHKHIYDEYGLCFECDKKLVMGEHAANPQSHLSILKSLERGNGFECDKPIPKSISQLNKELSAARKEAGYVEWRGQVKKDQVPLLDKRYPKPTFRNGMLKSVEN